MTSTPRRFVLSTNIPTPYRLAFFEVLARELAARAISFEVFFYARTEPNRQWQIDMRELPFRWTVLPGVHPALGAFCPHFNPTLALAVRRAKPTWLLIAGAWNTPSSLLALNRRLSGAGVRLFWSEGHAQAVLHPTGPIAMLRRRVLQAYDGFVVPNAASERFVLSELAGAKPVLRLPNTVDESFYLAGPGEARPALRAGLEVSPDDVVLLCVAQLTDRKGVVELAAAARSLPEEQRRRVLLVFAGSGTLGSQVLEAAEGVRTRLLGHVGPEVIRRWLYAADLFVLASKIDPNPLSAIEAAFCGVPLVLSARAGNADDLLGAPVAGPQPNAPGPECPGGWRISAPQPEAIRRALSAALGAGEARRRAAGLRAKEVALSEFSRDGAARGFVDHLLRAFPAAGGEPDGS